MSVRDSNAKRPQKNEFLERMKAKRSVDASESWDARPMHGDVAVRAADYEPVTFNGAASVPETMAVPGATARRHPRAGDGPVRHLRDMCAEVVAAMIDHVEDLSGIPWDPMGRLIRHYLIWEYDAERPTDGIRVSLGIAAAAGDPLAPQKVRRRLSIRTIRLLNEAFPDLGPRNTYCVLKRLKIPAQMIRNFTSPAVAMANWLKSLDLSETDFSDAMADSVARLTNLEVLDLSNTALTVDGLRTLARPILHARPCPLTGLPTAGLVNLRALRLSGCAGIADTPLSSADTAAADGLDAVLMRFPSLAALDLSCCAVEHSVRRLIQGFGWRRLHGVAALFPGYLDSSSSSAIDIDDDDLKDDESPPADPTPPAPPSKESRFYNWGRATDDDESISNHSRPRKRSQAEIEKRAIELHDAASEDYIRTLEPDIQDAILNVHGSYYAPAVQSRGPDGRGGGASAQTRTGSARQRLGKSNDVLDSLLGKTQLQVNVTGIQRRWWTFAAGDSDANISDALRQRQNFRNHQLVRTAAAIDAERVRLSTLIADGARRSSRSAPVTVSMVKNAKRRMESLPEIAPLKKRLPAPTIMPSITSLFKPPTPQSTKADTPPVMPPSDSSSLFKNPAADPVRRASLNPFPPLAPITRHRNLPDRSGRVDAAAGGVRKVGSVPASILKLAHAKRNAGQ